MFKILLKLKKFRIFVYEKFCLMYKVGDKFICVVYNEYNNYVIGNIIQIIGEAKYLSSLCVSYDCIYYCIYVNEEVRETFFDDEIHDYFIPLAEWRERQIKSVIDEL